MQWAHKIGNDAQKNSLYTICSELIYYFHHRSSKGRLQFIYSLLGVLRKGKDLGLIDMKQKVAVLVTIEACWPGYIDQSLSETISGCFETLLKTIGGPMSVGKINIFFNYLTSHLFRWIKTLREYRPSKGKKLLGNGWLGALGHVFSFGRLLFGESKL